MADMVPQGTQLNGVPHGHESADANMRSVTTAVVVLMATVLVTMLAMAGMFTYLNNRERAKDIDVPEAFAVRQLPPGPPLLPSPKQDELPWAAYQNERREQEEVAAKVGIIDRKTGAYQVPLLQPEKDRDVAKETDAYFKSKPQWEQGANRYTQDAGGGTQAGGTGGMTQDDADTQRRFGTSNTSAPEPKRPGDNRPASEVGPAQISTSEH